MTDPGDGGAAERALSSRRDLLKALLLGATIEGYSRVDALKMLVAGSAKASPTPPPGEPTPATADDGTNDLSGAAVSGSSPIPVRATESVSVRDIAEGTSTIYGNPIEITEVAKDEGLLDVSHNKNSRNEPPFALRELITSQDIAYHSYENEETENDSWWNWVGDHSSDDLTEFEVYNEEDLREAIIWSAQMEKQIRAVGSGHSHSEVAAPDLNFIKLSNYSKANNNAIRPKPGLGGLISEQPLQWRKDQSNLSIDPDNLFRVEAGATIKYLNRDLLFDKEKALLNMGSFDGQTLAGAINTSTHGTGSRLGSLADTVKSVELMAVRESPAQEGKPLVRKYRIEPEDGITDRSAFEDDVGDHGRTLIQNDDVFHSVVVGYGCMGVAYSYTIEVRNRYILHEHNITGKWEDFKNDIDVWRGRPDYSKAFYDAVPPRPGVPNWNTLSDITPTGARHFHFLVNLAQIEATDTDDPRCLLVSHREPMRYASADGGSKTFEEWPGKPNWWDADWPPERADRPFQKLVRNFRNAIKGGFHPTDSPPGGYPAGVNNRWAVSQNNFPFEEEVPGPFESAEVNDPTSMMAASYVALRRKREDDPTPKNEPEAPPTAISTEIAVPADQVVEAVEAVFDVVKKNDYTYNIPMGVRFVSRGPHALSPEYLGEDDRPVPVAKIEVPFMVRPYYEINRRVGKLVPETVIDQGEMLEHANSALKAVEDRLYEMVGGKPDELEFARPHMGKTNHVGRGQLERFYEGFDTWQAVHQEFDAFGTFDNGFTRNKGISIDDSE
ncbi:MAG: FAD-binding protein [Halovenus sp.]